MDRVRVERPRSFGDVYLGWTLWRGLGLDRFCGELLPEGREGVPWATMSEILVLARLCEPSSELHIAESWYGRTALDDILGVPEDMVNDDRRYRALDPLGPHREALERFLRGRLGELFDLDCDLLLYDVTCAYFEGQADGNSMAKRGQSRDHRPDCKQVCIVLVVTRDGMPLGYELFNGNRVDVTMVEEIVGSMEARFGLAKRVRVMDRGIVSQENVSWLERTGRRYVLGASRTELKRWRTELANETDWNRVREGVEVKLCTGPEGNEALVLCRSAERTEKEKAMHERFALRFEEGLQSLERRLGSARQRLGRSRLDRKIGRILGRNSRAAGRLDVTLEDDPSEPSGPRLAWTSRSEWDEWARISEGCYALGTNILDWKPKDLWSTCIQLTPAEAAFRIQKSDLAIRPVWHQEADRVKGHILVCFLAYVLWKTLEKW